MKCGWLSGDLAACYWTNVYSGLQAVSGCVVRITQSPPGGLAGLPYVCTVYTRW